MTKEKKRKRPLWLRIFLKVPEPNLRNFSDRFQGVFYLAILPALYVLSIFLNLYLIMGFPYPWNAVLFASFNSIILILLTRVLVGRSVESEEIFLKQGPLRCDFNQTLDEYVSLLDKRKKDQNAD